MADSKFEEFLGEFIRLWESQLEISWDVTKDFVCMSEEGPHLSLLPDEFLPSLDRYLHQMKTQIENDIHSRNIENFTIAVKALIIVSRNLDNIPFIASCQTIPSCISISSNILAGSVAGRQLEKDEVASIVLVCLFLETLYDPYFSYRKSIVNQTVDTSKIKYQPALLQAEIIPFIYDCFQHLNADSIPVVAHSLLYLFGAIIKGAQHNAAKAIAPATVQLLQKAFLNSNDNLQLASAVLHCEVAVVHSLLNSRPDQCQIEVGEVMEIYQNTLGVLANQDADLLVQIAPNRTPIICLAVRTIAQFLRHRRRETLQILLVRTGIVDFLIMLLFDAKLCPEDKRFLVVSIIKTMTAILHDSKQAQELLLSSGGYQKLFEAMKSLGQPTKLMIDSLICLSQSRDQDIGDEHEAMVRIVEPIAHLVDWLPDITDPELQYDTASAINQICSFSLQSKAICCQRGLLSHAIAVLESHATLSVRSIKQMLRLIQSLGSHSITAAELKLLLRLMRDTDGTEFPYSSYILHCLSSMAKKDAACQECHYYFDIQYETEGISVSDILQWQNPGYGLSVCTWLRLDALEHSASTNTNYRRQLFNLTSSKGHCFEGFFLSDGTLVVSVTWKKEYTTAMVHSVIFNDHQWHSICISFNPSRRLFGQSHLSVYVDGTQRLTVNVRIPPVNEPFSTFTIGAPVHSAQQDQANKLDSNNPYSLPRKKSDVRSPGLSSHIPNYFSLPISLSSLKSTTGEQQTDPEVRTIPLGSQDSVWGRPTCLHGQIGVFAVLQDSLSIQNVRTFHEAGTNNMTIWSSEDTNLDIADFFSKVAICISARAHHNSYCMDLSSAHQFPGSTKAPVCTAWDIKEVLSCIGGVQALFPILETVVQSDTVNLNLSGPLISPDTEKPEVDGWEVLPSSTYADWKLEQNPVSGFLSLLRNVLHHHSNNTLQLVRGSNIAIIGSLMQKVQPSLIDVQVLMAVQLLVEFARDAQDPSFLQNLYQHILFDMRIWARSQFHVRIGHVQYLSNLIHEDRHAFRKKYGPQYLLDVIKQHYNNNDQTDLSSDDRKTMRQALLGILKMYVNKEVSASDVSAITGFLWTVRDNEMITEMLDVLLTYVENKSAKDQFYLLFLEPRCAEILYALLLEKIFTTELREKVLKLLIHILRTDRAYEKSKSRLYLHDIGFQGLLCLMQGQPTSLEITHSLTDVILSRDHPNTYTGAMALAFSLAEENLEIKLEFSKRLLGFVLSRPNAPSSFVKQTSWQECLARLLVRKPIAASTNTGIKPMVPDLIDLDVEAATYRGISTPNAATTPSSPSKVWPNTPAPRDSGGMNLGLSATLEQDIKDVAESVSNLVAGAVTGNLNNIAIATGNLQNAAEVLTDNLQNVAGNLHTNIHSAVNSAYSLFRQKTLQVQGSLEELGENTIQRLKRRSQSTQSNSDTVDTLDAGASNSSSPRLRHPYRFLVAPLEVAVDALNVEASDDDFSRPKQREHSLSVSSRTSSAMASKNLNDFAPFESVDVETYSLISEVSGQWSGLVLDPTLDPEEDLCMTVLSIYLVLLWRGIPGCSKEDWRERSQILSCINLLGLNNELYRSHLEIKRRLIEMILQAATNELKHLAANAASRNGVIINCQHAIRWVYDLVVLDPHEDEAKKMSLKLLELTLAVFDALNVFQEDEFTLKQSTEVCHVALGLLLRFASSSSPELCAIAAARLHAFLQFRSHPDVNEVAFVIFNINSGLLSLQGKEDLPGNSDCFSCLIPILKAALEKVGPELEFEPIRATFSTNLFDQFQSVSKEESWKTWIDDKIRPRSDRFRSVHLQALPEAMNQSWAESDELAMLAVHRRYREVNESKIKFQVQILDAFRSKQTEEQARFNALLSHQRGHALVIRKKWRQLKQFLIGPRGSWAQRVNTEQRWKLSLCENRSRMRLKLVPNPHFDPHIQASRLRDNAGIPVDLHSPDSLNCLLPSKVANQALKRALNPQEPEDSLTEEDFALAASLEKEELGEGKEKVTTSEECELVTLMSVIKGRLEISRGWICFWDAGLGCETADRERADFKFALSQLQEVHLRRYNLRRSALEFFLVDHTTYFVNFNTKTRNRIYSRILSLRPPNLLYYSSRSPADVLRSSGLTQRWVQREISNFDYLMQLNTIAGRTYNDLSQYPVFPWILADYQSETLDLTNPATFRDLSRPIGVVNPKNAKEVRAKYDQFEDPSGIIAKFHYGTHYSNAAGVLHYLVRMEPFTSLHIELQSGRFDVADRQFHSLNSTWRLLMDNPNDVKELIPEFFCQPEFLVNMNRLDLGILQATKQPVDDVELPPWAKSPQDFIDQHRKALESDYVSAHLHEWIDLIFGYKQRGPAAVEALNVFYYCSYEGAVDLDAISDPVERQAVEGMINHFGQTPCQLFKESHPMRLSQSEALAKSKFPPSVNLYFESLSCVHIADLTVEPRDWIVLLTIPNSDVDSTRSRGYGPQTAPIPDILVSISRSGCIGLHNWASHDKTLPYGFSLERDSTLNNPRNRRRISDSFHPSVKIDSRLICVSSDCKSVFVGGQLDKSVKVYALPRLRLLHSAVQHIDIVTCLALDEGGSQLITGSRDTTCIVWDISSSALKSVQVLYGHDKPLTCVGLSTALDMAVSGSLDGTVNVHTIKEGQYIRTLHATGRASIDRVIISQLLLSDRGDVVFTAEEKDNFSIQAYTINGERIGLSYSPYAFTALASASDGHVVCGDLNGNVTIRRIITLVPVFDIPMQSPVEDLVMAPRNTQLLVALRDGKVVVVAPNVPLESRAG